MCSYTSILYIYTYIHQYFMHIYLHKYTHTSHSSHVNTLTSRSPHLHQDIHVCIHGGAHGQLPAHTICMYNAFSQTHTYILLSIRMCLSVYIYIYIYIYIYEKKTEHFTQRSRDKRTQTEQVII